jgi:non-ribosomal peptide synthetase component F
MPEPFRSLHSGFLRFEKTRPDLIALSVGGTEYSYGEAGAIARRWAGALTEAVCGRPARVGILAARNQISYLGVLAALYAGAAFVPLNPRFPASRTRSMIEQAQLDALIVDEASQGGLPELLVGLASPPVLLLFTSGSTRRAQGRADHARQRPGVPRRQPSPLRVHRG